MGKFISWTLQSKRFTSLHLCVFYILLDVQLLNAFIKYHSTLPCNVVSSHQSARLSLLPSQFVSLLSILICLRRLFQFSCFEFLGLSIVIRRRSDFVAAKLLCEGAQTPRRGGDVRACGLSCKSTPDCAAPANWLRGRLALFSEY